CGTIPLRLSDGQAMTNEELDRLAALIADELKRSAVVRPSADSRQSWLPAPIRPEPPSRGGEPAPWTGAGQALGDIAPVRTSIASRHRADAGESAAAIRSAAAGKAAPRTAQGGKA